MWIDRSLAVSPLAMLYVMETEAQYENALARIYELMQLDLTQDSPLSDELDALALLVEDYEQKHYLIGPGSPKP